MATLDLPSQGPVHISASDLEGPRYSPLNPRTLPDSIVSVTVDKKRIQAYIDRDWLPKCYTRAEHAKATVYKSADASNVVKCSWLTSPAEAAAMLLVRQQTKIPIPSVIFSKVDDSTKKTMICMSYIEGTRLSDAWPHLNPLQKAEVEAQLRAYLAELRALEPPVPAYIGGVSGGPLRDVRLNKLGVPATGEAVSSIVEFEDWLLSTTITALPAKIKAHIKDSMAKLRGQKGYRIVFTHGGMYPHNILVRKQGDDRWEVVGILDWSSAGWYPEYWEFVKAMEQGFCSPDGCAEMVALCLPEYKEEVLLAEFYKLALNH
ncbi:hypothetical protein TWF481_009508 [Arthrobotrys musiformis]|uniref:Aminoglycoside phosphotransferase domain-containing protein n=1 Tax=Arthrobotrys musiformis TaxID=47236 RepID=A0AAV9W4Y2_9PEZI